MEGKKSSPASMLIALGGLKKPPGEGESESAEDEMLEESAEPSMSEVKSTASADAMAAVKAGDAAGFEDALTRFFEACGSEGYK